MKQRVLLADDHQLFREALRSLLEKDPQFEIVAETGDGIDVIRMARETVPDIVCMDVNMPGMNGIETTRQLKAAWPDVKVVALSAYCDQRYVLDMINAGALAYVTKAAASVELLRAIESVSGNRSYLCPDALDSVRGVLSGGAEEKQFPQLSAREREVLQRVATGLTSVQIADQLHIATSTVEVHRRNIMRKLDLHNVADLTRYAIRSGIVANP
jgi:two-component system NarL family response regulator